MYPPDKIGVNIKQSLKVKQSLAFTGVLGLVLWVTHGHNYKIFYFSVSPCNTVSHSH